MLSVTLIATVAQHAGFVMYLVTTTAGVTSGLAGNNETIALQHEAVFDICLV